MRTSDTGDLVLVGLDRVGRGGGRHHARVGGVAGPRHQGAVVAAVHLRGQRLDPGLCLQVPRRGRRGVAREIHGDHAVDAVLLLRGVRGQRRGRRRPRHRLPLDLRHAHPRGRPARARGGRHQGARRARAHGHGAAGVGGGRAGVGRPAPGLGLDAAGAVAGVRHPALLAPVVRAHGALARHAAVGAAVAAVHARHVGGPVHVAGHGGGGGGAGAVHAAHVVAGVEGGGRGGGHVAAGPVRPGPAVHAGGVVAVVPVGHVPRHAAVHVAAPEPRAAGAGGVRGHEAAAQRVLVLLHQGLRLPPWSRTAIEI